MIEAAQFIDAARAHGFATYAGVPCSFLTPFINHVIADPALQYIASANEGDAVATAAGAAIGGRRAVVMMQNSGLGNAVSPLTSLNHVFRIPALLICTHRGAPGVHDEPQHELMGRITGALFDTMEIPWAPFPTEAADIGPALARAMAHLQTRERPYALVMAKGSVASGQGTAPARLAARPRGELQRLGPPDAARPTRAELLRTLIERTAADGSLLIASTGFAGRELYALADRAQHLYMVGSMGCASSLALGLALAQPARRVIVIDGDGAALMRMGNLATVGAYGPANLVHLVLDNEAHESTGAQATVSASVDFAAVAQACGYARALSGPAQAVLEAALHGGAPDAATAAPGPVLAHLKIATGTLAGLPRPSVTPPEVLRRLMAALGTRF